ncbi:MAG: M28 family peptidase [Pyrinomonadaceae bacterium]
MKRISILPILLLLAISVFAQKESRFAQMFDAKSLESNIRFLSSDGFEGRAPGSRGGELAAEYLAKELQKFGVKPGNNGSFFQPVGLVAVKSNHDTVLRIGNDNATFEYQYGKDYVTTTGAQRERVNINNELVFVGYGIDAPEQKWDDYKGKKSDFSGKILVMLVNDPPPTGDEPDRFGGKGLTYYGRWTYKFEEAARRGAAGAILIHTTESAGYGWNVVETSLGGGWRFEVERGADSKEPFLRAKAWVTEDAARRIFAQAGQNYDDLKKKAENKKFEPVNLGLRATMNQTYELKRVKSNNVVGFFEGRDPELKNEHVIYTAHWDHLGVGKPNTDGDDIYNGALDNASGISQVLALAEAITKLPQRQQPKRSQVFLFTTAEEQGLLGAEYYAENPVYPLEKCAANINIDGGNFYGRTKDFGALGAERSSLQKIVDKELEERGLVFSADDKPEQGFFFRSDHFPFAKKGVPALSIHAGKDYIGRPAGWAEQFFQDYNSKHYHQPSDEFREDWVFDGMIQMLDAVMGIGLEASNVSKLPKYNKKDEFAKAQPGRQ